MAGGAMPISMGVHPFKGSDYRVVDMSPRESLP
jgi:hypothetical protein